MDDDKVNEIDEEEDGELDNIIILSDENGEDVEFEFLDLIEYDSEEYVVLLPANESENEDEDEDGEVVILKVENIDSDEESYVSIDDMDTLNAVFEIFKEKFKDEFNFSDGE